MDTVAPDSTQAIIKAEALAWPERAMALVVVDGDTYRQASELLKGIKALRARIAEVFDPHIKRAFDAHRALIREKADAEAPLSHAERTFKDKLLAYDTEQERLRREEEARRQAELRRQEEEARLAEAAALEAEGVAQADPELLYQANELIEAPVVLPPVSVPKATPKVAGITFRETWKARVLSKIRLIQFVAAHPEYEALLDVNLTALNQQARSLKGNLRLPGVQAYAEKDVAAGRG